MYKVAICDDNPADLQLITDYLTEPEFHYPLELSSFHDGVELAQAYKKEGQFDLIILDMMMDRLNGIETALKIRKGDQNVAILIVTATVEYAIEGYKINAARYIVKPVSKPEFQKITKNIFASIDKKRGAYYRFPSKSGTTVISILNRISGLSTSPPDRATIPLPDGSVPSRSRRKAMAFSGSIRALS